MIGLRKSIQSLLEQMIDGDDFRKSLSAWRKSLPEAQKEEISIMEDIIMDIIDSSKKGKIYGKIKQVVK